MACQTGLLRNLCSNFLLFSVALFANFIIHLLAVIAFEVISTYVLINRED